MSSILDPYNTEHDPYNEDLAKSVNRRSGGPLQDCVKIHEEAGDVPEHDEAHVRNRFRTMHLR